MSVVDDRISKDIAPIRRPTPRKPRPRPTRAVNLIQPPTPDSDGWFAIRLAVGKDAADYLICPFEADWGQGFTVEKLGDNLATIDQYDVNIDGQQSSCTCPGFSFHDRCKHVEGLLALQNAGRLPQKQKHAACPSCCDRVEAPGLCGRCAAEEEAFAGYHQVDEMEAGGLAPFADEPPELAEEAYHDPADFA